MPRRSLPAVMDDYGHYWDSESKNTELYIDYLLNYNKRFGDYDVSASAGWVGHTIKGEHKGTSVTATHYDSRYKVAPTIVNYFRCERRRQGGYFVLEEF